MNEYRDRFGLYHDRPTDDGYISGNGVLYTAYAKQLELINAEELNLMQGHIFKNLIASLNPLDTRRYPISLNPDSLDNIIGFNILFPGFKDLLKDNEWYFNGYYRNKYSWTRCFYEMAIVWWKSRKLTGSDKRNYWWENGYYAAGKAASFIWPQYRYFFGQQNWLTLKLFKLHCKVMAKSDNTSAKNLCLAMAEHVADYESYKLFDKEKQYADYFPKDHPFNTTLK